jgi:hypothetical protein
MTSGLWFMASVAAIVATLVLVLHLIPAYRAFAARRFGRAVWLAMPTGDLLASVERRVGRRAVAGAVGGLAALAIIVAGLSTVRVSEYDDFAATWVLVGGFFVGIAIGSAVNVLTEPRRAAGESLQYARAEAVDLGDYVAPIERQGARIVVVASVVVGAALAVLSATVDEGGLSGLGGALVVVAFGLAALVLFEVGSRRLLARGRPAGSPTELAWDDALRSSALRDLVTAPLALGFYSLLVLGGELANRYTGDVAVAGAVFLVVVIVGGFAALVFVMVTRPQRHYLRRLWPELAATQDAGA